MLYFVRYRDNLGYEKEFDEDSFYVDEFTSSATIVKLINTILPKDGNDYMCPTHSKVRIYCIDNGNSSYAGECEWIGNDLMLYHPDGRYGMIN